jgi:hypothetical protein
LARALMKTAANCDKCGESQNTANHETVERTLQPQVRLGLRVAECRFKSNRQRVTLTGRRRAPGVPSCPSPGLRLSEGGVSVGLRGAIPNEGSVPCGWAARRRFLRLYGIGYHCCVSSVNNLRLVIPPSTAFGLRRRWRNLFLRRPRCVLPPLFLIYRGGSGSPGPPPTDLSNAKIRAELKHLNKRRRRK